MGVALAQPPLIQILSNTKAPYNISTPTAHLAVRALSPSLKPGETTMTDGLEDLRDELTRWVDAVLLTSAALPSYLERRLEAAFDQVVSETAGSRDG